MNYYDALVHHRQRIEEVERQQENARHLRDSQRSHHKEEQAEQPKRPSAILRLVGELKTAAATLRLVNQKQVIHAGHPAAIKDVTC